jgi:succinate dehydrogenase / fumarate reductase iron-sulfur subunit
MMVQFRLPKHSQIQKGKVFKQSGDALSMRTFYIYRWNAEDGKNPQMDEFTIDIKTNGI